MPPRVLLVDDNVELVALLSRLIETRGWTPVTAARGRAAIELVAREPPAAAAVDVLLPDMMGYEVAAALRRAGIPFVFMTGVFRGGRAAADARLQHGAAGYFEKPFDARRLVEALDQLVPGGPPVAAPGGGDAAGPSARAAARLAEEEDFDVEVAVDVEEPADALELTGKVTLTGGGQVSAVLRGATITAAPIAAPAAPVRPAAGAAPGATSGAPGGAPAPAPPAPRPPPAADAPAGPREGRLGDNLPDLITAFYLAQQTGELTLQKGKVRKTLYFEAGRPCFAISNLVTDRFGPFLVRVGKVTQQQLERCQATVQASGRRTGDVLGEMGLLAETEKLYYVAQQVKAIVYSVFAWDEGEYRLHFADRARAEAIKIDLHPANLIVRGVKKLYRPERLHRLLSPEDRLMPSPQPAYQLHDVELDRWEAELLPRVDGTRTVAELVALAQRPEHVVYASLHALAALQILAKR